MKCLQEAEKKPWIIKGGLLHVRYLFILNIHTHALLESDKSVYQQEWDSLNILLNN